MSKACSAEPSVIDRRKPVDCSGLVPLRRCKRRQPMETKMKTETIDAATALATERVGKARSSLILEQTFYGVLVSQVEPVASRQFPTMATNGKQHFFNPDFIATLSQKELLGVQQHETEHDARRHHTRRNGRDPDEWNICCDYAINIDLIDAGVTLPADALIDAKYRGMSAEDIYRTRELDREKEQPEPEGKAPDADEDEGEEGTEQADTNPGQSPGEEGDEAGDEAGEGEGQGDADGEGQGSGEGAGEPGEGEGGNGGGEPGTEAGDGPGEGQPASGGDPGRCGQVLDAAEDAGEVADVDAKWERLLRQAASLSAKRGEQPGHVTREIERADHPPQDWRETLRAFFDGGASTMETWSRPNRRLIGSGLYLPGREREGINRAAFLVDTSGSMDKVALEAIAVEVQAALDDNVIDELVVIYGDTQVTRVDTYRQGDEVEFDPKGGGGTVLQPLFDHVADLDASLIVCFTDGFIDVNSSSPEPSCPVLFAFTGYPQHVRDHIANAPWGAAAIDVGSH
jgi:predicted metal-dependent peptidase